MKQISSYLLALVILLGAVSCTSGGFKKTKSGLLYHITSDGKGEPVKKGQWLKLNVVQKLRDSLLYTSEGTMPAYIKVDSSRGDYSPIEILPLLRKGDSAVAVQLVDTLIRKYGGQLPPFLKKKDKISTIFKVVDVLATDEDKMKDQADEASREKTREVKAMEDYLAAGKINAEKTAKGTYVVVTAPGEGMQVDSGKQVSVRYTGKLFPSGKVFESNMSGPNSAEPFKFVIGQSAIIQGWDDGLRKFKKGGKGVLYIPAFLAYDQQPGPGHRPYENLIFDVEIVDVTDAPKQAAAPTMSPAQIQAMQQAMQQQQQQQHR